MSTKSTQQVHIYIDNSNVYIEGHKSYSSDWHEASGWRYDVSKLRDVLLANSGLHVHPKSPPRVHTTLYGSEPPPGDIWTAMECKDVTIQKYDRHHVSGKEKMVDAKMVADITEQAIRNEVMGVASEFIIVTGDADIFPAVEKVIKSGFRAQIWSWKASSSKTYRNTWDEHGRLIITTHLLDDYRDQFGYLQGMQQSLPSPCRWRKYCNKRGDCGYFHPEDDLQYFKEHGEAKKLVHYWKCTFGESCDKKGTCFFWHNELSWTRSRCS